MNTVKLFKLVILSALCITLSHDVFAAARTESKDADEHGAAATLTTPLSLLLTGGSDSMAQQIAVTLSSPNSTQAFQNLGLRQKQRTILRGAARFQEATQPGSTSSLAPTHPKLYYGEHLTPPVPAPTSDVKLHMKFDDIILTITPQVSDEDPAQNRINELASPVAHVSALTYLPNPEAANRAAPHHSDAILYDAEPLAQPAAPAGDEKRALPARDVPVQPAPEDRAVKLARTLRAIKARQGERAHLPVEDRGIRLAKANILARKLQELAREHKRLAQLGITFVPYDKEQ